jgi:hypothetical protein
VRQFALDDGGVPAAKPITVSTSSAVPESRFGAFAFHVKKSKQQRIVSPRDKLDILIRQYFKRVTAAPPEKDVVPFEFWRSNADEFGPLAALAKCLLPVPATSAPVERVFSQAGIATCCRKNRIGPTLLKMKLMLEMNQKYL